MKKILFASISAIFLMILCISCTEEVVDKPEAKVKVGDILTINNQECVVFSVNDDGEHGKAISLIETTCIWSSELVVTGATNVSDGTANMQTIMKLDQWKLKYPPFYVAFNIEQNSNWYIASKEEMELIFSMISYVNASLESIDASKVLRTDRFYWTSTEASANEVYAGQYNENGVTTFLQCTKNLTNNMYSRPICKF